MKLRKTPGFSAVVVAGWLVAGAALAFAALFLWRLGLLLEWREPEKNRSAGQSHETGKITALQAVLSGFDDNGQPYELSAARVDQPLDRSGIVILHGIKARLVRHDDEPLFLTASQAFYNTKTERIRLSGAVQLMAQDDFVMRMPEAEVYLPQKQLYSKSAVMIDTKKGDLRANSVTIGNNGREIVFGGGVRVRLFRPARTMRESAKGDSFHNEFAG